MSIGEFCNRDVIVAKEDTGIVEIARLMREYHVGNVVIVDESQGNRVPVGIITDRDIVIEVIGEDVSLGSVTARDVMSYELVTTRETEGLWETLQRMRLKGIRRMPVVNEHGALVGIITVDDILELLCGEFNDLIKIVIREQDRERQTRASGVPD